MADKQETIKRLEAILFDIEALMIEFEQTIDDMKKD